MPEQRIVLKNCGVINPRDINTYFAADGFQALKKATMEMTPEQVVEEVKASGLRGRGGAGFPCGLKWDLTRRAPGDEKYLICNADEGEVGTFKDRYILQNDPFSLVEGIAIAAYAIGARQAFIYLRGEYHFLLDLLLGAIGQAKEKGFLEHVNITVREGAGAYICGEESALMDSIEGRRGEARYRPPFPPTEGLWRKPTVINNVETLMNISRVLLNGAQWFSQIGTERSKGTKVFSVSGDVASPGVYEMVLGSQLRELVLDLAQAERVKLIQIGGATGRIIPADMLDTPLSFETILGAGGVTVFDESRDVIDIVYRTMEFLADESCGKCSPCREGTEVMLEITERFSKGEGTRRDIRLLEELSGVMSITSLCGLGQAAPIPVTDTLKYFRSDYESKIKQEQVEVVG
ncbi:MAG: NADH-ubiquinone oxidoreductase-F iron-sulfur binding region domain-containing protein [Dehalococcoidales bacterium]|nr:NADH-ubiquinone oxidoreductase-F iron-sulfur binding region domain-containing protein [Dehalococcoidales bacterium]